MTALVFRDLVARREKPLFAPINQRIEAGSLVGIVGPNGAGKTSLLNAIIGRGIDHAGTASYAGKALSSLTSRKRARVVSYVGQDTFAPNDLQVRDIVAVGATAGGHTKTRDHRVAYALKRLAVTHLANRRYSELSGGERQLVQIARSLAQDAPIMLLDEPTSALDLSHELTVLHALKERAAAGRIVIVTIHDLTQALRWADTVVVMADGVVTFGRPTDVLTTESIRQVYGVTAEVFDSPSGSPTLSFVRVSCPTATTFTYPRRTAS